jgi:hypothetical protein
MTVQSLLITIIQLRFRGADGGGGKRGILPPEEGARDSVAEPIKFSSFGAFFFPGMEIENVSPSFKE